MPRVVTDCDQPASNCPNLAFTGQYRAAPASFPGSWNFVGLSAGGFVWLIQAAGFMEQLTSPCCNCWLKFLPTSQRKLSEHSANLMLPDEIMVLVAVSHSAEKDFSSYLSKLVSGSSKSRSIWLEVWGDFSWRMQLLVALSKSLPRGKLAWLWLVWWYLFGL